MNSSTFEPIFPNHAIERCSATFAFRDALPDKLFTALTNNHDHLIRTAGFEAQNSVSVQIEVGHDSKSHSGILPAIYNSFDRADAIIIAPQSVSLQTVRYIRWAQFESKLEELVYPILDTFLSSVNGSLIIMNYLDCFIWEGTWDNFDSTKLLGQDSDFACRATKRGSREWHSHSGWTVDSNNIRRIYNVNINAVSRQEKDVIKPAIAIFTLARDQNVDGQTALFDTIAEATALLDSQHRGLKDLLGKVISPTMAQQIRLHSS